MSAPNRHKRPELERSEPIRSWSGMFGVRPPNGHKLESAEDRAAPSGPAEAARPSAPNDPVSRGVDLGYRVIEQYLQQGQSFARAVAPGRGAGGPGLPGLADPQRFIEQLARSTYELADTFLGFVSAAGGWPAAAGRGKPGTSAAQAVPPVGAFEIESLGRAAAPSAAPSSTGHAVRAPDGSGLDAPSTEPSAPLISTDVSSPLRTEVTVELKPGSAALRLSAHELRAADPALPRIAGVELESHAEGNRVVVRLRVPDAQPEATYSGLIIDEATHLPRGSLTVRVLGQA